MLFSKVVVQVASSAGARTCHGFWVLPFNQVPREFSDLTRQSARRAARREPARHSSADKVFLSRESLAHKTKLQVIHERLGHLNIRTLKRAIKHKQLNGVEISATDLRVPFSCECCIMGKAHKVPYARSTSARRELPGECVSIDRFEVTPKDIHGHRYGIVLIDWATRYCWCFFTKTKLESEWLPVLKAWRRMFVKQTGHEVRCFYSDNEFATNAFQTWRFRHGIRHRPTTRASSGMNAQAERVIRTIKERARTAMLTSDVHARFWSYACSHQVTLMNCLPHAGLRKELDVDKCKSKDRMFKEVPFYCLYNEMPNLRRLRLFGAECFVLIEPGDRGYAKSRAVQARTRRGMYLGFSARDGQRGHMVYVPHADKVVIRRHVYFVEQFALEAS